MVETPSPESQEILQRSIFLDGELLKILLRSWGNGSLAAHCLRRVWDTSKFGGLEPTGFLKHQQYQTVTMESEGW